MLVEKAPGPTTRRRHTIARGLEREAVDAGAVDVELCLFGTCNRDGLGSNGRKKAGEAEDKRREHGDRTGFEKESELRWCQKTMVI